MGIYNNYIKSKYTQQKWAEFLDQAEKRRDTSYEDYKEQFIDSMHGFASVHESNLNKCLSCYKEAISSSFCEKNYALISEKKLRTILSRCKVMILTANPIEKAILHYMIASQTKERIRRIICGNTAYFVFKWGEYWIAHVHQTQMGATRDMGTNATIHDALKYFTPNVIFSLGVAFGIDYRTQSIGDVIVSKRILPYSENKRDEDKVKPDRSQDKFIDKWLHVRLVNAIGFLDSVTYGDILTGGSVLSSFEEKDKICLGYSKSDFVVGGEMEGNALFQFADSEGIPGVVIKGICDWGVAKNGIYPEDSKREEEFKDSLQAYAMCQVVNTCSSLFADPQLFSQPKNEDLKTLKRSYALSQICIGIYFVFTLAYSLSCLYVRNMPSASNSTVEQIYSALSNPLIWLLILVIVFSFIALNAYTSTKRIKYNPKKELKDQKFYKDLGNGCFEELIANRDDISHVR